MCWCASGEIVLDLAGGDQLAAGAELVEDALGVDSVPSDDCVDDDREAERLFALLFRGALPDVPLVGVEDRPPERVELLALVQLSPDAGSQLLVGEPIEHEVCLDQPAVLLQRLSEWVAPRTGLEAGE
jgi:hypothetical protein